MRVLSAIALVGATVGGIQSAAVAGGSVAIGAAADNTMYSESGALSAGGGTHFFAGESFIGSRRAMIMFDIASAVPAGSTITGVSLRLFMDKTIAGPSNVSLHALTNSWGEGTTIPTGGVGGGGAGGAAAAGDATWTDNFFGSSSWTTPGGDFVALPSATTSVGGVGPYGWNSAQMIADVQNWLDNPGSNNGWLMIGDETFSPTAKRFASRENPNAQLRPLLTIDYIPAPGGAGVLALAGAGVLARRRR